MLQIPLNIEYFSIKNIIIKNNQIIPTAIVTEKSNYILKKNIFSFGKQRILKTLMTIPQFESINVIRAYPDKIVIDIKEKKPWVNLLLNNKDIIIDKTGIILNMPGTNEIDSTILPVIKGLPPGVTSDHKIDISTLNMLKNVLTPLETLFKPEQLQFNLVDETNIEILADDILLIKVGDSSFIEQKRTTLKTFLNYIQNRWNEVEYIDIKCIKNPVIKFKQELNLTNQTE
ncbi:MAG: hypothetical protein DKM50_10565 [Candidatus Margulisiibacteriota bacterium]|nr:MAG: hypothetical protein A2X43_07040 [Candidatus Margulisbacteria bacterium GWD2_39_127]OGI02965.1 MAG: hypothetical protein A2X42_12795 [Candidatus Margulisbacteria bacterium GWF2_38_17]OGI09442.1 MAG: hypothetical protein A2X41_12450 [Candidatus Margulisbacteria bacterium GWE2_39_32]PZM78758.1 MAG: hypothetical protein DKM50_10565 [Candidatus Margulisiibacteriota bacterium]HAR63340.1 hypothetical protein [Candidatus Margulisiibacteriota bacterium]